MLLAVPASFASVNPDGSYGQKITIEAAPGKSGLTPQIELAYNSNGGNGVAGVGWTLSFPAISRAANKAIHYDTTDFFVGPSGRLTDVSGNRTLYQPQNQDWSRYIPQGQIGDAPASWIVKTNDGRTLYFGDTADSFVVGVNNDNTPITGGARLWALSKIVDQWGNAIEYVYQQHGGQIYLSQIKYARSLNGFSQHSINFKYTTNRPDIETKYYGGRVYTQWLLSEIAVTTGQLSIWPFDSISGDMIRRYTFTYDQSPASGRSRLTAVQIQSASQTLAHTIFTYNGAYVNNYTLQTPLGTAAGVGLGTTDVRAGDFTGDGLSDLAAFAGVSGIYCVMTGSSFGFNGQACMDVMRKDNPDQGDFNGDGRMDLIGYTTVSNIYCIIYGAIYGLTGQACMPASGGRLIADFNGDGRDDMGWFNDTGDFVHSYGEPYGLSGPFWVSGAMDPYDAYDPNTNQPLWERPPMRGPFDPPPIGVIFTPSYAGNAKTGDFNGDGYADLAAWTGISDIWCIAYGSPRGIQKQVCVRGGVGAWQVLVADFNNDGYSDLSAHAGGGTWCISHGSRTGFKPQVCMPGLGIDAGGVFPGDYNGDGYPDLAAYTGSGGTWCITYGNGYGINPQVCPSNVLATGDARVGDFNGDGYSDLTAYTGVNGIWVIARGQGHLDADRIVSITASSGARETISYTSSRETAGMFDVNDTNPWERANNGIFFVVSQITNESNMDLDDNGLLDSRRTTYSYRGAKVIASGPITERTNLGFASMTVTDTVTGHYTVTQYRQNRPYHGTVAQQIEYDQHGNKVAEVMPSTPVQYKCTETGCVTDTTTELMVGRRFMNTGRNITVAYENGAEVSRKYEAVLTYDNFGNPTVVEQGIESNGQRKETYKFTQYVNNTDAANFVMGVPYAERSCLVAAGCSTGGDNFLSEARSYYDNQPLGTIGQRRLVTKKETYTAGVWLAESFTYDMRGNVSETLDAQGVRTEIVYDSDIAQYPTDIYKSHGGKSILSVIRHDHRYGKQTMAFDTDSGNSQITAIDDAGFVRTVETRHGAQILAKKSFDHSAYNAARAWVKECSHYTATTLGASSFGEKKCTIKYSDVFGRVYREEFPEFVAGVMKDMAIEHRFDNRGRETKVSQPFEAIYSGCVGTSNAGATPFACQWSTKSYDLMNRVTESVTWNGRRSTVEYQTTGLMNPAVSMHITTGPDGKQKRTYTNIHGKTVATFDAQQSAGEYTAVSYIYDTLGRLTHVRAPQGQTTVGYVPNTSLQQFILDPVAGQTDYEYYLTPGHPSFGKLKKETRGGFITSFEYNASFGRLSKTVKTSAANPATALETISYTYDQTDKPNGKGRLTTLVHQKDGFTISERYSYDERGEVTQTVRSVSHETLTLCANPLAIPCTQVFGKTKDATGRVTDMLYPDGKRSTIEYIDAFSSQVSKIKHDGSLYAEYSDYKYDVTAHIGKITYGNGLTQAYNYYADTGMLDTFKIASGTATLIDVKYEYDSSYNIYRINDRVVTDLTATFEYDAHNRIKTATLDSGKVRTYRFDRSGQRNTQGNIELKDNRRLTYAANPNSPDNRLTYPASDEVFNETTGEWLANQTFTWSASGNLLTKGPFTFTYDSNNMMVSATEVPLQASPASGGGPESGGGAVTHFYYDQSGQRFLKTHTRNGVTIKTWYLGDGIEYREKYIGVTASSPGTFDAYQTTKYIYGIDDKKLASITGAVKTTQPTATTDNLYSLADSYASTSASGLFKKTYYTFYGLYQHENTEKAAKVSGFSLAALLLLLYLIRTQRREGAFPIWMRATAMTMLISFVSVNCGTGNAPGTTPADLSGPGSVGTPGDATTAAQPTNTFTSALYTGLPVGTVYYSHNHLGSGALVTDSAGNEVFRITYTEYGEIDLANSGKYNPTTREIEHHLDAALITITAVKYTGQEYDPETGFYYYNARYYDPQLGVFTTPDTEFDSAGGSFGFNRHMYVAGNPVRYTDPSGHSLWDDISKWDWKTISAVATGGISGALTAATAVGAANLYNHSQTGQWLNKDQNWQVFGGAAQAYAIGAATYATGGYVASLGAPFANTLGILAGSIVNSTLQSIQSDGKSAFTLSFGAFSIGNNGFRTMFDSENKWYEDMGYIFGALANIQDVFALFGTAGNIDVNAKKAFLRKDEWYSHSSITESKASLAEKLANDESIGADDFENLTSVGYKTKTSQLAKGERLWSSKTFWRDGAAKNDWTHYAEKANTWSVRLNNVNKSALQNYRASNYSLIVKSCSWHASMALTGAGVFTLPVNFHPYILNAQLALRQAGIAMSPYLIRH